MNTESKKTRIRRTNEQVDKAISDALTTLAGQMPLARITVNQLLTLTMRHPTRLYPEQRLPTMV